MKATITDKKARRLLRNDKIKERYLNEVEAGGMKSAIIIGIAKSYNITVPTVYSIIK